MQPNSQTQSIYDRIRSLRGVPKPIVPTYPTPSGNAIPAGNPGFVSKPIIPKSTLNSSEPGSLVAKYGSGTTPQGNGFDYATPQAKASGFTGAPVPPVPTPGLGGNGGNQQPTPPVPHPVTTPTTPPVAPPLASQTSQNNELTYPNAIRSQYAAGQTGVPEEQALRKGLASAGLYYGNKGAAPLAGFNIGGAAQDFQQAQSGLLNSIVSSTTPQLQDIQAQRQAALTAGQSGVNATAPVLGSADQLPFNPGQGTSGQFLGGASGPFQAGVIKGNQALGQNYSGMYAASQAATGIKNTIQQYISANPNVNPSQFTDVNTALQLLNGHASNPQYQTLSNYLSEYVSTLAPILGVGGDTTNLKTEIAQGMVNAQAQGQSISQVLDNIENLARQKLIDTQNAGSGNPSYPSGGSTGGGGFAEQW